MPWSWPEVQPQVAGGLRFGAEGMGLELASFRADSSGC